MERLNNVQLTQQLHNFIGTEGYYKHPYGLLYTDGVQFFALEGGDQGAYWLLDYIALHILPHQEHEPFISIEVKVGNSSAVIKAHDGNYQYFFEESIQYTDLQPGVWKFFLADKVLLLPGEY